MSQIEFTPNQVEELKNYYLLELEKLHQRSVEITGILRKLMQEPMDNKKPQSTFNPLPETVVKVPEQVYQPEEKLFRKGRPTRNPDWKNIVPQLLKEQNKPLTKGQILKLYEKQYNVSLSGSASAISSLNQSIQRLRVKNNILTSSKIKGHKGNFYSLVKPEGISVVKTQLTPITESSETGIKADENVKFYIPQFVVDTLNKTRRILSLKDIVNYAMVRYSIPENDKKVIYGKISPVLTHMSKNKDKIRTIRKDGLAYKFYGLTEWFNNKGELIVMYK